MGASGNPADVLLLPIDSIYHSFQYLLCRYPESAIMSSEGVTKVNLEKHTPGTVTQDKNSELDKEDFQKAAQDAKESVSDTLQSAKEFMVGESNDAEDKTKSSKVWCLFTW